MKRSLAPVLLLFAACSSIGDAQDSQSATETTEDEGDGDGDPGDGDGDPGDGDADPGDGSGDGDGDSGDGDGDGDSGDGDGDELCFPLCPSFPPIVAPGHVITPGSIDLQSNTVTITNQGPDPVAIDGWSFCNQSTCQSVDLGLVNPTDPWQLVPLQFDLDDQQGAFAIYAGDVQQGAPIEYYMQYGSAGWPAEDAAEVAGLWTAGTFAELCSPSHYYFSIMGDARDPDSYISYRDDCTPPP